MIVGLGIEGVEAPRFARAAARFGDRLARRLFTDSERAHAAARPLGAESLAVRFAAKCATRRALGGGAIGWRDIEVVSARSGAPELRLHGAAARRASVLGVARSAVSLSHDRGACVAHVVLERDP
ncbi:MAG TPA: holo-ACP synthase [Myxococcota bacterium]|nr:holo-ACP synthase [Myxococcota bacterium]